MCLHFGPGVATFIHIPKCAGTSVKKWAKPLSGIRNGAKHIKSRRATAIYPKPGRFFTIVRNPYDRAVSLYHFCGQLGTGLIQMGKSRPKCYDTWKDLYNSGFKSFLHALVQHDPDADTQDGNWHMWDTQWSWIEGISDAIVLRYENLDLEFRIIQDLVGCHDPLPLVNQSQHADYQTYLDLEIQQLIQDIWAEDFEKFGYQT